MAQHLTYGNMLLWKKEQHSTKYYSG